MRLGEGYWYSLYAMAGLLIKDLPTALHRALKARAATNRRSLSAEAITILEAALNDRVESPTLEEIDHLRTRGLRPLRQAIIDIARREDSQPEPPVH